MTARSAVPAVCGALYTLLNVSALTSALGYTVAVYDYVPAAPAYPYVQLTSPTENRLDTFGKAGKDITVQAHLFANTAGAVAGSSQVQNMLDVLAQLTNYATLDVAGAGFDLIFCRPEDAHDAGDEEIGGAIVKHYVQMIRVQVMER